MPRKNSKSLKEKRSPAERLSVEDALEREFEDAQRLLQKKAYRESFKKFKWIFANSGASHFRLTDSEIKNFLKHYPPAIRVIRKWRNDKENLLLSGQSDGELIREWMMLNSCLKENHRTESCLRKLKENDENEDAVHSILWTLWPKFVRARKYEEIRSFLRTLAWLVFLHVSDLDSENLFGERTPKATFKARINHMRKEIVEKDCLVFEAALGLGDKYIANLVSKKILSVEASDQSYANLISGACRTRNFDEAEQLFDEACNKLKRHPFCNRVVKKVPKAQAYRFKKK